MAFSAFEIFKLVTSYFVQPNPRKIIGAVLDGLVAVRGSTRAFLHSEEPDDDDLRRPRESSRA